MAFPAGICGNFTHQNSLPSKFYSPDATATTSAFCALLLQRTMRPAGWKFSTQYAGIRP